MVMKDNDDYNKIDNKTRKTARCYSQYHNRSCFYYKNDFRTTNQIPYYSSLEVKTATAVATTGIIIIITMHQFLDYVVQNDKDERSCLIHFSPVSHFYTP